MSIDLAGRYSKKVSQPREIIDVLYKRSYVYAYNPDVSEPIITVCKLMLEEHNRFHLEKGSTEWIVIIDKLTKQKFVSHRVPSFIVPWSFQQEDKVVSPSFLTDDENKLLAHIMIKWFNKESKILEDKIRKREQKRNDKHRQEMIDLYKEDM